MWEIEYTNRFKRSFKRCMIQTSTSYQANIQVIGYAICNLTGCRYGCPVKRN